MTDSTNAMRCNILEAAYQLAQMDGWTNFKRDDVAEKAGVATGSVSHHFKTMNGLRDAVMRKAIQTECLSIVADGLAARNKYAQGAPEGLKREALATLM